MLVSCKGKSTAPPPLRNDLDHVAVCDRTLGIPRCAHNLNWGSVRVEMRPSKRSLPSSLFDRWPRPRP